MLNRPLAALLILPFVFIAGASAAPLIPTAAEMARLPLATLPVAQVQQRIESFKGQPLTFSVAAPLSMDLRNGSWDAPSADIGRWRLSVASQGARSLSLQLSGVHLPQGAQLWFYGADGTDMQGPFDAQSAGLQNGLLKLPLVRSAASVLEVQVPTANRDAVTLHIDRAYHGYRTFGATEGSGEPAKANSVGGTSGSCNINAACTEGNDWRDQIRSTVLLTIPAGNLRELLCTGSLVNNTRRDDRSLILTANHCSVPIDNVSGVTAYFNVQTANCAGTNANGGTQQVSVSDNINGRTFLARDSNSDFTLFELASKPPTSFNAYYAGWDARSGVAPTSGVTLHHPSGDDKKISVYSTPATAVEDQPIDNFTVDAWRVNWQRGTTEGGSSGSGLWNQNKRLVGVLSGGAASCASQNDPDFFARIERAWQANSATAGQLKAHLDPINTGCLVLNSKNPGTSSVITTCDSVGTSSPSTPTTDTPRTFTDGGGSPGFWLLGGLMLAALARRRRLI